MTAPERRAADLDLDAARVLRFAVDDIQGMTSQEGFDSCIRDIVTAAPKVLEALAAERRLREQAEAAVERLRQRLEDLGDVAGDIEAERDSARAELARLREAVEALADTVEAATPDGDEAQRAFRAEDKSYIAGWINAGAQAVDTIRAAVAGSGQGETKGDGE